MIHTFFHFAMYFRLLYFEDLRVKYGDPRIKIVSYLLSLIKYTQLNILIRIWTILYFLIAGFGITLIVYIALYFKHFLYFDDL